jgi:uncharacterized protein with PQ loop repeat
MGRWLVPLAAYLNIGSIFTSCFFVCHIAYLNCIAYTTYGILRKDFYIFFSNITGLCLATFYALIALTLLAKNANAKDVERMNIIIGALVFGLFFYSILGLSACFSYSNDDNGLNLSATAFGMTGCCFSIMYYTAPLSTALQVIATKDASSFYAPMIILNLCNATLWMFYGFFAINQPAVYAPNMVGCALSIFQLSLVFLYRNSTGASKTHKSLDDSTNGEVKVTEAIKLNTHENSSATTATGSPMWKDGSAHGVAKV